MREFDELLEIADKLLAPGGCPWDLKQTFTSLQPYVLEEAHEVVEAVDSDSTPEIIEELGDLLYTVIFYAKLAQKEGRFSIKEILSSIAEKLIRRHPHIFGSVTAEDADEVVRNWEKIKKQEKEGRAPKEKKSFVEELPPTLSLLMKAQKVVRKKMRAESSEPPSNESRATEEAIGAELFEVIKRAEYSGVDAESSLRRYLSRELF